MPSDFRRSETALLVVLAMASLFVPQRAAADGLLIAQSTQAESVDLASGLAADGTFLGVRGASGTVDASAWTLVSDLAAGEPPRFEPASDVVALHGGEAEAFASNVVSANGVEWLGVGSNGAGNGAFSGRVRALALVGNILYVGGLFTDAAGIAEADYVARWNGSSWSALGSNGAGDGALGAFVNALGVSGGSVFVGGHFTNAAGIATADFLALWNGSAWSALGGTGDGALNNTVNALAMLDGNAIAGGFFTDAGGSATADYVARWTGSVWTALGSDMAGTNGALNTFVYALARSGTDVYVGGTFTDAAGITAADRVARWSLSSGAWSALGTNGAGTNGAISGAPDFVVALAASGSDVFVGGSFADAGGIATADNVARWNGTAWSALGSDAAGTNGALNEQVRALAVSGTNVYAAGFFTAAGGTPTADYVARWNGSAWSALGSNNAGNSALTGSVDALTASGSAVYVGGSFINAADIPEGDYLALALVPGPWSALGSNGAANGALGGPGGPGLPGVRALAFSGSDLYVGGNFANAGGLPAADFIARWDGTAWSALGGLNGPILAIAVSGSDVIVGGSFTNAGGIVTADHVARWNGTAWSALGSNPAGTNGALNYLPDPALAGVGALAVSGSDLFVGGIFTNAAGYAAADFVARWSGTVWSPLGSNLPGTDGALNSTVRALAVSGTSLFVGGDFFNAAGVPAADGIASWSGSSWSALGSNGDGDGALDNPGRVGALAVSGSIVYVGGNFTDAAGNVTADFVARWDGSTWSGLGSNSVGNGALNNGVGGLAISGNHLYVAGAFQNAGGLGAADFVARWSGGAWSALGSNGAGDGALTNVVYALAVPGSDLLVGGEFSNAAGIPMADYVAAFGPIATYRPDGRIRKGSGTLVGNNIYNTTGSNQTRQGSAAVGSKINFTLSIQNDGTLASKFRVHATGTSAPNYQITYFRGTTNITTAVVNGTYETASIPPGGTLAIKAQVKVLASATVGSSATRLLTVTSSVGTTVDAVKFIGKRA